MTAERRLDWGHREDRYDSVYANRLTSATINRVWRAVYGDDYPELDTLSFVTRTDLTMVADLLALKEGELLLDVGCGAGGPGVWLADRMDLNLVGVDVSPEAVRLASSRPRAKRSATYQTASMSDMPIGDASVDGVVSLDAIWMVMDKTQACAEIRRTLRPGAPFALTTWEPSYLSYEEILRDAGFLISYCQETPDWRPRQLAVYAELLANAADLRVDLGDDAAQTLLDEAATVPALLEDQTRIMILAHALG